MTCDKTDQKTDLGADLQAELKERGFSFERIEDENDVSDTRLVLRDLNEPKMLPLCVDFLSGQLRHRRAQGLAKGQPLPRALGLKSIGSPKAPFVLDATAGLGTDAFVMAAMGCRVRAIERNPVVFALVEDGYRRLRRRAEALAYEEGEESLLTIANRLSFEQGNARDLVASLSEQDRPDVVYLDPMYPEEGRSKSALPKKGMQVFRRLIGDDLDASDVFAAAITCARERVVVKRPLPAPPLSPRPTHVFEGKTARYDMYLVRQDPLA